MVYDTGWRRGISDEEWDAAVKTYKENPLSWHRRIYGPRPLHDGCRVPPHILAANGYPQVFKMHPNPEAPNANGAARTRKSSSLVSLNTIRAETTDWLWHNRIPRGAQTINTGLPGTGKSQQLCDIVARVSTGAAWLDGSSCPQGDVILLTAEDHIAKTVIPRLMAAGADLSRVHTLPVIHIDGKTDRAFLLTEDIDELERHLMKRPETLLVGIDPITAYMGAGKIDSHKTTDVRGVLGPIAALAERRNVAIYTVTHPPKATSSAINAFVGSQAFIAAARVGYLTIEEVTDGKPTGRYLVAMVKTNLGPKMPTLAYRLAQIVVDQDHRNGRTITGSYLAWEDGTVDMSADQAIAASNETAVSSERGSARKDAKQFLKTMLADGPVEAKQVISGAHANLISKRTMERAQKELGIERYHQGAGKDQVWFWRLPAQPDGETSNCNGEC